jgi:hypothetical protein
MPKRKPPPRPLPNPRTAQSPDAAELAKRLMSPAGLQNPLLAMARPVPMPRPQLRNNKRGRR